MPWKHLPVLKILTGMSSPASACSKESASSETVVPLTLVFGPGSTVTIFSYISTLYQTIWVLSVVVNIRRQLDWICSHLGDTPVCVSARVFPERIN